MSSNRLFFMIINNDKFSCYKIKIVVDSWLWNLRFGHLNFGSIKILTRKNWITGLPLVDIPDKVCETCIIRKNHIYVLLKCQAWKAKE